MHSSLVIGRGMIMKTQTNITVYHAGDKRFTWIILFNPYNSSIQYGLMLFSFYS